MTNIGLMLMVSLPLFILSIWIEGLIVGPGSMEELLASFVFSYIVLIPPAVGGALIQQLLMEVLPRPGSRTRRRVVAVASCLVIFLGAPLFGTSPDFLIQPLLAVPVLIALSTFGMLQRLPPNDLA